MSGEKRYYAQANKLSVVRGMYLTNLVALVFVNVLGVFPKYINDIHGNTVIQDRSTGFHVFELHGFSMGITSSIFVGAALTICATYLAFRLGLGRLLSMCCCKCAQGQDRQQSISNLQLPAVQQQTVPSAPQAVQLVPQQIPVQQAQATTTAIQSRTNSEGNLGPFTVKIVR